MPIIFQEQGAQRPHMESVIPILGCCLWFIYIYIYIYIYRFVCINDMWSESQSHLSIKIGLLKAEIITQMNYG